MTYTVIGMDLVSTSSTGSPGNGHSMVPQFSPDGTKVVFSSGTTAASWGAGNTIPRDIFMKDLTTGVLTPISKNAAGAFSNSDSINASFSADGTKIVFESTATNLLGTGNDTNGASDIFVYDIAGGTLTRASTTAAGTQATGASTQASFAPDGHVIFTTTAALAGASDTGGFSDIYQKDLSTGAVARLSTTSTGTQINGSSSLGSITHDGGKLGFISTGTNVTGGADGNGATADLFVKDLSTGTVTIANTTSAGVQGNGAVTDYAFSADGTKVLFTSTATNLVSGDSNLSSDVFLKDLVTGQIQLISKSTAGALGNDASSFASFSADGTKVIFQSNASNLVAGDTNFTSDIFIKDLVTGEVSRVTNTSGAQPDNITDRAVFSPVDNTKIAFESAASNLTAGDANGSIYDVFVAKVNSSPVGVSDFISVTEGIPTANLTSFLLSNDSDSDTGDSFTILSVDTSLTAGTVTFNAATQSLTYNANPSTFGLPGGSMAGDIFRYTIVDSKGAVSTADVLVQVTGVDNSPEITDDQFELNAGENTGNIFATVLSNDTDPEGDIFTITSVNASGTLGTVTFDQTTHTLIYTATPDAFEDLYIGETFEDNVTYTVTDATGETATGTITVTVHGTQEPNSVPDAVDDAANVVENGATGNLAPLMLSNDSDPDAGDSITITNVNSLGLTYGTVTFDQDTQSVIYSANATQVEALAEGQTAVDVFTYTITDEHGEVDNASVTVTITGANDAPVAVNDAIDLNSGSSTGNIATLVLGNDTDVDNGDTKEISAVNTTGTIGTVTFDESTQTLSYSATGFNSLADGETATDTFAYTVIDSHGATSTATVTVTVTGSNDGPVAVLDVVNVNEDTATANIIPLMLSNDSDADNGDNITVTSIDDSSLSYGEITFDQATQSLVYNANNATSLGVGQTATDEFTYTITDGGGETSTATVSVVVTGVNDDPHANNDAANVDLGATTANIAGILLSNDTDVDNGDTRTISAVNTTGTLGTVTFDEATQTLTYSADNAAFPGLGQGDSTTDTFTYTITDSQGATSTATVTMTITAPEVNDAPVANNDNVSVNEDASTGNLAATLLTNDSDPDAGDSFTITAVDSSSLTLGSLAFDQATQSVVYSANNTDSLAAGQTATETFSYTITDENGATDTASVTVTVTGLNDAPEAQDDASSVDNGSTTANLVSALLANDTDIDTGDTRTISAVNTTGTLGTVTFDESMQTLTYQANPAAFPGLGAGDTATDTFTYTIKDASGATSTATVTMTVNGVDFNDAPVAVNDSVNVNEDASTGNLTATLLANDTDADNDTLHISSVDGTGLALGALTFDEATQSVVYTANNADSLAVGETATESFTYTVEDPSGETSTATVNVTVTGVNDAPTANNDGAAVNSGASTSNIAAAVLANDTDPDTSDVLKISAVNTTGTVGTVTFDETTQSLSYTASGAAYAALGNGQTATDTFTYTADDGHGGTSIATVTVTVTGGNDGPTANSDAVNVNEDADTGNIAATLLANDTDPDTGDTLHIASVDTSSLTLGAVAFDEATQSVVYSANNAGSLAAGQTAAETFSYTVEDETGATSTASVTVTVTGLNDGPVAVNDSTSVTAGGTTANLVATLLGNDTDIDTGDTKAIASVDTTGTQGTVAFDEATQSLTYTAGAAFGALGAGDTATDTFTYTMRDGSGATSTATVTVTVTGANDGPTANDDAVNANEDASTGNLASLLLGNDTDPDTGDSLHISAVDTTGLALGTVAFNEATQSVVYNANNAGSLAAGQTATETFSYTIVDESGATDTATVTVTVTGANDAPAAVDDAANVDLGATTANLASLLLGNDTDVDTGDTRTISAVGTTGTLGTVTFDESTQTLTYQANPAAFPGLGAGDTATDTFTYTIKDAAGATSTATVTMTITGTNDAPVAADDSVNVNEDASTGNLAAILLNNDSDDDVLHISSVDSSSLSYGSVSFDEATQSVIYTADNANELSAGVTATESFTYTIEDPSGETSTATVNVTITGLNDAPEANNDGTTANAGGTTSNLAATLLGNDTDIDSDDALTIGAVNTTGTLGTVTFSAAMQSLTYTAGAAFVSLGAGQTTTDTFSYTVSDGHGGADTATVTVTVTGANDGPTAVNDNVSVNEDATTGNLAATLLANDTDPDAGDTKSIVSVNAGGTTYGTVSFNAGTQTLTYAADKALADTLGVGQTATDTFTYTMKDAAGATSTATVTMTVTGINDAPVAVADAVSVSAAGTSANLASTLLSNDTDVDNGDTKAINAVSTTGTKGVVAFDAGTQSLTYTAGNFYQSLGAGQTANDTFTYTMKDAAGATSTATVTMTVTGVNDGPTAVNDAFNVNEDATTANLVTQILANDTDPDAGDTKRISSVSATGLVYGTVTFNEATQSLTYAANKDAADALGVGQTATDTFTYTMRDAAGATSTATVAMTIKGVNDAPVANDDAFNVTAGAPFTISIADLFANDSDIDGTFNFNGITANTAKGTIVNNGNGTLTYTPNSGYTGADSFTYSVKDNNGATDTAKVNLTIKANGKYIKGTDKNDTLKGGTGNDTIEGGKDKGSVTLTHDSYFLGTKTSEKLVGNDTDSNSSTIGWQKAWGQYTPVFDITAVGIGETEATGYKYSTALPSFANSTGNAYQDGIGVDGKANLGGSINQEIGYDPRTQKSEKLVFDAKGELMAKAAFDLSYFYSKDSGADKLGSTKYSETGHWEAYKNGVLVGQGDFVAGVADTNASDGATLSAIGSSNNESLLTLDFASKGGFDKVVLSAKQYSGLNANQSAAAGKALGATKADDSSDYLVRNVKIGMLEDKYNVTIGDHLYGGAGNDTFIFNKGAGGVDAIHDFTDGDIIKTTYKLTDVVTGFGTDTIIFKNGTGYEAIVAVDNGHHWDQSDFIFAV